MDFTTLSNKELSEAIDFHRRQRNMSRGVNESAHMRQTQVVRLLESEEARRLEENIGGLFKDASEWERSAKDRGLVVKSMTHPSGEATKYQIAKDKQGNNRGHFDHGTKSGRLKEEVEQIDELSKKTLGAYVKKAKDDLGKRESEVTRNRYVDPRGVKDILTHNNALLMKRANRRDNINKAVDKLTAEEVEQINELSRSTLGSYANKALNRGDIAARMSKSDTDAQGKYAAKRLGGAKLAAKKLGAKVGDKATATRVATNIDKARAAAANRYTDKDDEGKAYYAAQRGVAKLQNQKLKEEADLTKIDTKTLQGLVQLHKHYGQKDAFHKAAADRGEAELKNRMKKEEAEQIDELSKKTLGSYIKRAANERGHAGIEAGSALAKGNDMKPHLNTMKKRLDGVRMATNKLTKEAVSADAMEPAQKKASASLAKPGPQGNTLPFNRFKSTNGGVNISAKNEEIEESAKSKMMAKLDKNVDPAGYHSSEDAEKHAHDINKHQLKMK